MQSEAKKNPQASLAGGSPREEISLSRAGQLALAKLINNPRQPSIAMRDLMSLP